MQVAANTQVDPTLDPVYSTWLSLSQSGR